MAVSTLGLAIIIVLALLVIGAIPSWPHSRNWGYWPSSTVGVILGVVLVLVLIGYL